MVGGKVTLSYEITNVVLPLVKLMYVGKNLQRHETWTCLRR
jgi:hypothetical protein